LPTADPEEPASLGLGPGGFSLVEATSGHSTKKEKKKEKDPIRVEEIASLLLLTI
jgi:hypothetical protein